MANVRVRPTIHCLVADFALQHGILDTRTMPLDTGEANVTGKGTVSLRSEAKHVTIGSLAVPIDITGHQPGLGANNDCAALIHDARNTPDPARQPGETH